MRFHEIFKIPISAKPRLKYLFLSKKLSLSDLYFTFQKFNNMLLRKMIRKTISSTFLNNECIFYQVPKDLLLKEGFSNWSYSCQKIIQCRLPKWDSSQRFITQILTNLDVFAWIFSKVTPKTFCFEKIDFSRFSKIFHVIWVLEVSLKNGFKAS